MSKIQRALLSVSDKVGLVELGKALTERGVQLIASGGTARQLRTAGMAVTSVSNLTGFPELLGGRVKTLHPAVHGGILARDTDADRAELAGHDLAPIDLVVCNLYPFEKTVADPSVSFEDAIEQIDIGGVTLLRAAAKNCARVTVLCDPNDYENLIARIDEGADLTEYRRTLGRKAFAHTARYDAAISAWFAGRGDDAKINAALPARQGRAAERVSVLRYGENPHQSAALYKWEGEELPFEVLQGKAMSYNNLVDLEGALDSVAPFTDPAVAIIKHTNPCGLAVGENIVEAYKKALASDPVSAFGSIIAINRPVDVGFLEVVGKLFVEVMAAPEFTPDALEWLANKKKNCRAVRIDDGTMPAVQLRTIRGGLLAQTNDRQFANPTEWRCVTDRAVSDDEMRDAEFAWNAVRAIKSNAIVICRNQATVGVGAGQMNRLESAKIASKLAGEKAHGAVAASDAFFPFADGLRAVAEAGVSVIVQPGGSIRDDQVIAAANELGISLILTGIRHFKH